MFFANSCDAQTLNQGNNTQANTSTKTITTTTNNPSKTTKKTIVIGKNNWYPPSMPKQMALFGEKVPLDRWEVKERLDRELLTNNYMHTSTFYILKLKTRYFPIIERILKEEGVPDDFKYLCVAESSLQNLRSPANAEGMWQFLAATARSYGLVVNDDIDERYHLEKATIAACKYLKEAKQKFGTWTAAAASYNCGMGGYSNFSNYQGTAHYYDLLLPEETNRYIFRIMALKMIMENPKAYGFNLAANETYPPFKTKKVKVDYQINNLAVWALQQGSSYKLIRLVNPWIRGKTVPNKSKKTYYIEVPTS